jgi:DNA-binding response OmpR family regulator
MPKILVMDDEKEAVDMLITFLSSRGYTAISASDGVEGLKKLDEEHPDVVLCDIRMPKKDGFQFLTELRQTRKWTPVIIVSAVTEPAEILKGYNLEADYYITKPLNLEDVLKAVKIMLSLIPLRKT